MSMLPISSAELAQIQADASSILDKTCEIQRKSIVRDSYGSSADLYNTIATVAAGMSLPSAGQLANFDYLIGSLASWQVKLPVGTDVQEQDHLVIEDKTFIVQKNLTPRSYPALLTVLISEVSQNA